MDPVRFDRIAKSLSSPETRRRVFGVLTAVPVVGGLLGILSSEETEGKGRRKRRKTRNKRRSGSDKKNRKGQHHKKKPQCAPDSTAQTCAGTCGRVTDNCQHPVDCGPCTCDPACGTCEQCQGTTCASCDPCCDDVCCDQAGSICHATTGACCVPESRAQTCDGQCGEVTNTCGVVVDCGPCTCTPICPSCQICDEETGQCVTDSTQHGQPCGSDGQVCQANGTCTCTSSSCPDCTTCGGNGQCVACADCCDASGVCQDGDTDYACGSRGTCAVCTGQEQCQDQACVCVADCTGKDCGSDGCNGSCGTCTLPETCGGDGTDGACGCTPTTCTAQNKTCGTISDGCGGELTCGTCSNPTPICTDNVCAACTSDTQCGSGKTCDAGSCKTTCTTSASCGRYQICVDSVCEACDVCPFGFCPESDLYTAVTSANPGDTLYICPGTYSPNPIPIRQNLTLIGAGSGVGGTIIDFSMWSTHGPFTIYLGVVELRDLQVTRGDGGVNKVGGGIHNYATLSLTGVLVTGNTAERGGGIYNSSGAKLILNAGTTVTANTATEPVSGGAGGGIYNGGTITSNPGSSVSGNTPDNCYRC